MVISLPWQYALRQMQHFFVLQDVEYGDIKNSCREIQVLTNLSAIFLYSLAHLHCGVLARDNSMRKTIFHPPTCSSPVW